MAKAWLAVGLMVALLASTAGAAEPSRGETKYMRTLVTSLDHESEDVRTSARGGLESMGAKAAWYLVREIRKLKGARLAGAQHVLVSLGDHTRKAIKELGKLSQSHQRVLQSVQDLLAGKIEEGDGDVGREVDTILSGAPTDSWSSRSPITDRLVDLGRPAIPALLRHLEPARAEQMGMQSSYAVAALARLCAGNDVPKLGALLDKRWSRIAGVFKEMRLASCVPYLVRALERGQLTDDIGEACKALGGDALRKPAVAFLAAHGGRFESGTTPLLDMLVTMQASEALPHIRAMRDAQEKLRDSGEMIDRMNDAFRRRQVGTALAGLGDKAGLPMLIELLGADEDDAWMVTWVGKDLGRLTGQTFWSEGSPNDDAQAKYEAWWKKHGTKLVWNKDDRRFELPSQGDK